MCGIVGFTGFTDQALIRAMNNAQSHRGPDDEGIFHDPEAQVSLGMRRLSVIDFADGKQPMCEVGGRLWVVFNGEIFNAPALRKSLIAKGYRFQTDHSDTEILLHLYRDMGDSMVSRLRGMYAFVIYDREQRRLFGARDPLGIKPLHYSEFGKAFLFASELSSLLQCKGLSHELDHQSVCDFFSFQTIAAPHTIYRSIRKLPAGHTFEWNLSTRALCIKRFWTPFSVPANNIYSRHEWVTRIRAEFDNVLRRWSMSDVEIGCSLSGGIDSAALVGGLSQATSHRIRTYTLGFHDAPELDERESARRVAKKWGTHHHEIVLGVDDLLCDLDSMVTALGEPYAGGLPSWFVFKRMARDVKVSMSGTGGDELFGNYGRWHRYENPLARIKWIIRYFLRSGGSLDELRRFGRVCFHYPYLADHAKKKWLLAPGFLDASRPSAELLYLLSRSCPRKAWRDRIIHIDLQLQLPEEFLFMMDRFSMAHSIEDRPPFLDLDFVETVLSVPAKQRTETKHPKRLFLDAIGDLIPAENILEKKRGFVIPKERWMRGPLRAQLREMLDDNYLRRQGIFQPGIWHRLAIPFISGHDHLAPQLWTLFMFQKWYSSVSSSRGIN